MPSSIARIAVVLAAAAVARPAAADTEVLVLDPPAAPAVGAPARRDGGLYAEMSLGYGRLRAELAFANGNRWMTDSDVRGLRWALGGRVAFGAMEARLGAVLDVVNAGGNGAALGVETQLDWPLGAGWRGGARLSVGKGDGNGDPTTLDGVVGSAGLRLRRDVIIVGVDAVRVWHPEGDATGGLVVLGFGGRPGKYLAGTSAVVASVVGIILLGAMAGATTH
jgi:hypothetical protein